MFARSISSTCYVSLLYNSTIIINSNGGDIDRAY